MHNTCWFAATDFSFLPTMAEVANVATDVFPGEAESWRVDRTRDFFLVDGKGRMSLKDTEYRGAPMKAMVPQREPGSVVLGLVTEATYVEIPPQNFNEYLEHEGHQHVLKARKQARQEAAPGRERYTRYAKTIFHVGATPTDAALANLLRATVDGGVLVWMATRVLGPDGRVGRLYALLAAIGIVTMAGAAAPVGLGLRLAWSAVALAAAGVATWRLLDPEAREALTSRAAAAWARVGNVTS